MVLDYGGFAIGISMEQSLLTTFKYFPMKKQVHNEPDKNITVVTNS